MVHNQVIAKVNSYVDEEMKELVELLNTFDNIQTIESCQGGNKESAFIHLLYGEDNKDNFYELVEFAKTLADSISEVVAKSEDIVSPIYLLCISIEWWGDKQHPFICLSMPSNHIAEITDVFHAVRKDSNYDTKDIQQ